MNVPAGPTVTFPNRQSTPLVEKELNSIPVNVEGIDPNSLRVAVTDNTGKPSGTGEISENPDGTFTANITPEKSGPHTISISTPEGALVSGDSVTPVDVVPKLVQPKDSNSVTTPKLGCPVSLPLSIEPSLKVEPTSLKVDIFDKDGKHVGNGEISVAPDNSPVLSFTPKESVLMLQLLSPLLLLWTSQFIQMVQRDTYLQRENLLKSLL
eukprot:TRINITY_DN14475_c0_g1_i2.p1 TRINITY_DN14475_c0_g1~~TRINITY_DN14475_c0_g1_i2.p1  ORF type:complete len:218 (-),score=76.43 TRINITY_DN14475_c0_g1_i2:131-760(-)